MNVSSLLKIAVARLRNNAPLLLTASAVTGVVTTAVLAAKAAPRAEEVIARKEKLFVLTKTDKAKLTWKIYLPAVISGGLTISCVVLAHYTHKKRYAALMGVYALGQKAFEEYRESVEEVVSKKDKENINESASKKALDRTEEDFETHLYNHGDQQVVYDNFSGRYFKADLESLRSAENQFNSNLIGHGYGTLNELYSLMGIEGIGAGEDTGWNCDKLVSIGYNATLTERGIPVISIDFYDNPPTFDYYKNR